MAMNSEQANAFKAGSGIDPTVLNKFVLGFVLSVLFFVVCLVGISCVSWMAGRKSH